MLVRVGVRHPNHVERQKRIRALIDTGATGSTIHPRIVQKLGFPVVGSKRVGTVNQIIEMPEVLVSIRMAQADIEFVTFKTRIVPEGQRDDMLFGMDLLDGGIPTVDTIRRTWRWVRQRDH